jgi:Ulp1 family protease
VHQSALQVPGNKTIGLPPSSPSLISTLVHLVRYLHDESEHKKKQAFDDEGWELVTCTPDTPVQNNGSDCGVFSCMFADYLALNKVIAISGTASRVRAPN